MEALIEYVVDNIFKGKTPKGAIVDVNAADVDDIAKESFRPMELMLLSLGSCMGFTVEMILKKMRISIKKYNIQIKGNRAEQPPKVFTDIYLTHSFYGSGLPSEKLKRALSLGESYCSAYNMLSTTVKIQNSIEILED